MLISYYKLFFIFPPKLLVDKYINEHFINKILNKNENGLANETPFFYVQEIQILGTKQKYINFYFNS